MARVYELVLDIPTPAAQAWLLQRERSRRAHSAERLDGALMKGLTTLPGTVRTQCAGSPGAGYSDTRVQLTSGVSGCDETLAAAGLQIMLDTSASGCRVVVCQQVRVPRDHIRPATRLWYINQLPHIILQIGFGNCGTRISQSRRAAHNRCII